MNIIDFIKMQMKSVTKHILYFTRLYTSFSLKYNNYACQKWFEQCTILFILYINLAAVILGYQNNLLIIF